MVLNYSSTTYPCIESEEKIAILLSTFFSIIAICAICGNALIIYAFYKFKKLRTPTNIIVIAISISDIILALLVPFYVSFYFEVNYKCSVIACKFRYFFIMFCAYWSLLLMIGLAIDRYIAVLKPLRYNWIVRKERVIWFNVLTAIYMLILCIIPFLPFNTNKLGDSEGEECDLYYIMSATYACIVVCGHVVLTIIVTSILYWKIYKAALQHKKKLPNAFHKKWEANMTIMMVLILAVHLITLLPYLIVVMLIYCEPNWYNTLRELKKVTVVLHFSRCIISPFICAIRNKEFRLAFRKILGCNKENRNHYDDFSFYPTNAAPRHNETGF